MSVSVSFISASAQELERAEKEPDWAREFVAELYGSDDYPAPDRPDGGPGKAFNGLQYLLDEVQAPFEFLMGGDPVGDDGTLFVWSARQVESVARLFRATPWPALAAHYDPERMSAQDVYPAMWRSDPEGSLAWLKEAYEDLVAFFAAAAGRGYGALMNFSF
ncbi:DUF1877 family protein [Streptomyces sp. NPDC059740]|uniref:DUF1877 family protein n=1 Tax=Streptomyces sp. NPDC059740 TaxID=3346926 RepID=UPI0036554BB3